MHIKKEPTCWLISYIAIFITNIFDFAVILRLALSENKTSYELIYTMNIMHNQ